MTKLKKRAFEVALILLYIMVVIAVVQLGGG